MSIKHCSKCNTIFECCNEKEGCWCETIFISMDKLKELKEMYANCLCIACLKEYAK